MGDIALPKLAVAVCPGFHPAALTDGWVRSLPPFTQPHIATALPIDAIAIFNWLVQTFGDPSIATNNTATTMAMATNMATKNSQPAKVSTAPLIAIGFSAGVVGLTGALHLWQQQGGKVAQFFAVDGWGTPIIGLPVCRLSHDSFTHWSSLPLGAGKVNFYADPGVDHLQLWESPAAAIGKKVISQQSGKWLDLRPTVQSQPITAADFVSQQLQIEQVKLIPKSWN